VRRYKEAHSDWEAFPEKVAFQMNDTHPTLLGEQSTVAMDSLSCVCICLSPLSSIKADRRQPCRLSCRMQN